MPKKETVSKSRRAVKATVEKRAAKPRRKAAAVKVAPLNVVPPAPPEPPRDLRNREMPFADFSGRDLSGWNFFGTRLGRARFRESRLVGVNFCQSNLSGADFERADLTRANLAGASVRGARFVGAVGLSTDVMVLLEKGGAIVREVRGRIAS